jgi:hypothetical protein
MAWHILFKGDMVLAMDLKLGDFVRGDVLVGGTTIAAVAPAC